MTITVPPVDNLSNEISPGAESSTDAGAPGVGSSSGNPQRDLSAQVKDCVTQAKRYLNMCLLFLLSNASYLSLKFLKQSSGGCNQAIYQDLFGDLRHKPTRCGMLVRCFKKHSDFMKLSLVYRLLSRLLRSSLSLLCWRSCESGGVHKLQYRPSNGNSHSRISSVLSTLVLIMWSLLTITIGVSFVIIGGLISRERTLCERLIQVDISNQYSSNY